MYDIGITDEIRKKQDVIVHKYDQPILVFLNVEDNLSNVRKQLGQSSVEMDHSLSFAKEEGTLIAREDEENIILREVIDTKNKSLHLRKDLDPNWESLNERHKLDFGRHDGFKKADKRAYVLKGCEVDKSEKRKWDGIEISSNESKTGTKNLFLSPGEDLTKFGIQIEGSRSKKVKHVTNSTYKDVEYHLRSLKFENLEPTDEFIEAIDGTINSGDPREIENITKEFGHFIPREVTLGGKALFRVSNDLKENADGSFTGASLSVRGNKIGMKFSKFLSRDKLYKREKFELVGGELVNSEDSDDFDESKWAKTLNRENWSPIKFERPISIFQLLDEKRRQQILSLMGKQILHSSTEDHVYELSEPGRYEIIELPKSILEILRNKDADCSIFATVIDKNIFKKDEFICQILWPQNEDPRLVIHCIQKGFRKQFKAKILIHQIVRLRRCH